MTAPTDVAGEDTAQRERDELSAWLLAFHLRLRKATKRGQVELHVSLEDAANLLRHAQFASAIYRHTKARP